MPELVVLPPELVTGKKENRPQKTAIGRFSGFRIYGLRMTQAVQTPASTL